MSRYHTRHALARARGALSRTKRTTALLTGLAAIGATAAAMILPSSASAATWHGIYLTAYNGLALAAPNTVVSGSQAQLKTCKQNVPGFCTADGNIKLSQQFRASGSGTGGLLILNENGMCLTNRSVGGAVTFQPCGNAGTGYASQTWTDMSGVITNVKTGGNLSPATSVPTKGTPVITSKAAWTWGLSS